MRVSLQSTAPDAASNTAQTCAQQWHRTESGMFQPAISAKKQAAWTPLLRQQVPWCKQKLQASNLQPALHNRCLTTVQDYACAQPGKAFTLGQNNSCLHPLWPPPVGTNTSMCHPQQLVHGPKTGKPPVIGHSAFSQSLMLRSQPTHLPIACLSSSTSCGASAGG